MTSVRSPCCSAGRTSRSSGITTTHEDGGRRAGFVHEVLRLGASIGIPVAAGAEHSMTTLVQPGGFPDDVRYWGHPIESVPSPSARPSTSCARSIEHGATVIVIGPFTNLALFEVVRPACSTPCRSSSWAAATALPIPAIRSGPRLRLERAVRHPCR